MYHIINVFLIKIILLTLNRGISSVVLIILLEKFNDHIKSVIKCMYCHLVKILESVLCQLNALSIHFLFKENNFFVNCRHGIRYRLV